MSDASTTPLTRTDPKPKVQLPKVELGPARVAKLIEQFDAHKNERKA